MIVESAFLKLPELLTREYKLLHGTSEATVVHLLAVAILMELNARNVPRPFEHVEVEKPYPIPRREDGLPIRADLFVNLQGTIPRIVDGPLSVYGTRAQNWIEVKTFFSSIKQGGMSAKTANAGKIVRDLLRLCLLPGSILASRYFLVVFSDDPSQSIAVRRSNQQARGWLSCLLTEGYVDDLSIDLSKEPKSLREGVGQGFVQSAELLLNLKLRTMIFEPRGENLPDPVFWGFLVRIRSAHISLPGFEVVEINDEPGSRSRGDLVLVRDEIMRRF
jgi:hypothetical protein